MKKTFLSVPKDEARYKIGIRIKIGEELKARPINTQEELWVAEQAEEQWTEFNAQLCREYFSDDSMEREILRHKLTAYVPMGQSVLEKAASFRLRIKQQLSTLTSIRDRIDIIAVMPPAGPMVGVEATPAPRGDGMFKQSVENHPIAYAVAIAIASAIITAGIMGWVQNTRVEAVSTKCETEKTGMKNDYEAQIRDLKHQIQEFEQKKTKVGF